MCVYIYIYIHIWEDAARSGSTSSCLNKGDQGRSPFDRFDFSTWFGTSASTIIASIFRAPKTHAGPSFSLRKRFDFDRFDSVSVSI